VKIDKFDKLKTIVREVSTAVARWRETATATGLTNKEIERMASAFEHEGTTKDGR
jgi:serine/threonine-protein kinase HipA